jgi:hypothetical protein
MATTTNYAWETPDDTDLVKDGASAIRTLGSSIDSTVFTNSNNAVQKSSITAKGDILIGTGAGTFTAQGVGANGTVLTANSAQADGVEWAVPTSGGYTQIASGTLSGSEVSLTSIPGTYYQLVLFLNNAYGSGAGQQTQLRFNSDSGAKYGNVFIASYSASAQRYDVDSLSAVLLTGSGSTTSSNAGGVAIISNYASTTMKKTIISQYFETENSPNRIWGGFGAWNSASAITSIQIRPGGSLTWSGGTYTLYGVK